MKILQVNSSDVEGGAARAAYRIHQGLLKSNIMSRMLVQNKRSDDFTTFINNDSYCGKIWNKLAPRFDLLIRRFYKNRLNVPWSVNFFGNRSIKQFIDRNNFELVHMHWINNGLLSIDDISELGKPILWTLHDTWALTGGCHYFGNCIKYLSHCASCEQLGSIYQKDLSFYLFNKKYKSYSNTNITITTPSHWLADCVKNSFLLKNKRVEVIPNGIDINIYKNIEKNIARSILNIDPNEKVIMFGACSSTSDKRKGYFYLKEALGKLNSILDNESISKKIHVIVFGANKPKDEENFYYPITYTGHLYDDISLRVLYSCADVFVAPSKEDNLPNTIMESLSCAIPCVAFNIGGMPDMIEHKKNGYLATPYDSEDLARGISYILEDQDRWNMLSYNSRKKVIENFDINLITRKYINLYKEILLQNRS